MVQSATFCLDTGSFIPKLLLMGAILVLGRGTEVVIHDEFVQL